MFENISVYKTIKTVLYNILFCLIYYTNADKIINYYVNRFKPNNDKKFYFLNIEKRRSNNVQILIYHRINNDDDPFFPGVPVDVFYKQMRYLKSQFLILPLDDAIEQIRKKDVSENAVVITFDDGYKDNYNNAFPILKDLSIPATIFLATGAIDSGKSLWHDDVFNAFRETKVSIIEKFWGIPGSLKLGNNNDKMHTLRIVLKFLRAQDDAGRQFWIEKLLEILQVKNNLKTTDLMMTWADVKEMHQAGISFGSHTTGHPILSRLTPEKARSEIFDSKKTIEKYLGNSVTNFAYPNGQREDFNDAIKDILRDTGYACALTTIFGTNEVDQDLYELKRGTPWEKELHAFAIKLNWYKYRTWN